MSWIASTRRVRGLLLWCLATSVAASGCGGNGETFQAGTDQPAPFAAASMRVHPLTQLDLAATSPNGKADPLPRIVVHLELKDSYGDTVKALGSFHAELYRAGTGTLPGIDQRVMDWTEDSFLDPANNTGRFDPATRTYRIQLTGPEWLRAWKEGGKEGPAGALRLRVVYTTVDVSGQPLVLEDSYQFER